MKNNKDEKIVREAVEFFLETLSKIYPDRNRSHDILKKKRITYTGFTSVYFLADNIGQILYWNRKCTFYSSIKYVIQYCKIQDGTIIKTPYEFLTIKNDSKIGKIDV